VLKEEAVSCTSSSVEFDNITPPQSKQTRRANKRAVSNRQSQRSQKLFISSRVVFTKAVCASGVRSSINNSIMIGKKYLIKSAMASIGHGGRQGKIMNLELELEDDESEEDPRKTRDRGFRVQMEGKKISKVATKGKSRQKKPATSNAGDSTNSGVKKSLKPQSQHAVLDSLFKVSPQQPEPTTAQVNPTVPSLPARQPFATTTSNHIDWATNRQVEDDTCHTIIHPSFNMNKDPATSMQQEFLSSKPSPKLGLPMVVEVSIANSEPRVQNKTSALLSEILEELANKLSLSRSDRHSRPTALQELSEFVYKCENTEIDADVITSTKLGRYLQLMYLMILEFNSSDSPEYDNLIPRTSKLITKYKRIVTDQVAAGNAVQARHHDLPRPAAVFLPPGRPDIC